MDPAGEEDSSSGALVRWGDVVVSAGAASAEAAAVSAEAVRPVGGDMALLTSKQKETVAEAIHAAERETSGELVVVVTPRSSDYSGFRAALGLALALGASQECQRVWPGLFLGVYGLWLLAAIAVLSYLLFGMGAVLRWLLPQSHQSRRAFERALRAFVEEGVTETVGRSGVLIFVSELERQVVILADRGISERVPPAEWDREVNDLVEGLRRGQPEPALLLAIERIGQRLKQCFPVARSDNQLPNEVREV